MGKKVQYFDIILFAVIAGVLAIRLYRILGTKSKIIIKKNEDSVQNVVSLNKEKIKDDDKERENIRTEMEKACSILKMYSQTLMRPTFFLERKKLYQ